MIPLLLVRFDRFVSIDQKRHFTDKDFELSFRPEWHAISIRSRVSGAQFYASADGAEWIEKVIPPKEPDAPQPARPGAGRARTAK